MAEAIVSLAIGRISDLLIHEAVFLGGVREEVQYLKDELRRMQCFLEDADSKQEKDKRFCNQVADIRDLAYDSEDVIDDFILKVAHQGGLHGIIKRFTSIFSKPYHLHKMGMEIEKIQKKLENISKNFQAFRIPGVGEGSTSSSMMQQRLGRTFSHVEEEVVGLESMTEDILAQLKKEGLHVVSIVGMGGIGKTTLARKVYKNNDVKRDFDCFAWASISQNFMLIEVLHRVLIKVLSPSKEERERIDKLPECELITTLSDVLKEKRYLVVLDDVWKIQDWDILKDAFPRGNRGSKILITTRSKEVALHPDRCNPPTELPHLNVDEGWRLLKSKAFPENTTESHARSRDLETLGRKMVIKCRRLPLAIVVLGGLLATKKSRYEWEIVEGNIHAHLNEAELQNQPYGAVNGILVLSYNDLPYNLKPCFLYLGHYPEDWEISKNELIRLWIAEGFISSSLEIGGRLIEMEDVAENFLEQLINRCLVQVGKWDHTEIGVKTCRIHDLLRDLCVEEAKKENFLEIIQPPIDDVVTLTASMRRRVAIHPSKRYVCLKGEHPKLRSLLLFQNESLIELDISKCKNFKFLRVLKVVKRNVVQWKVSSEIGNLHHLRYLELICYFRKIILPRSIGKLKSLHTLRVFGHVKVNFNVLFKLERLRHIRLYSNMKMRLGPRNILKNIVTLKHIKIEDLIENDAVLNFTNLRSLGITFMRSKDVVLFLKVLIRLPRLQSLFLDMNESFILSYQDWEPLSLGDRLSKLSIQGKIQEDPHLRHHVLKFVPANIFKLSLWGSKLKQDPMAVLEKLPHLRILRLLRKSYKGTKLICSATGFRQLDSLLINGLRELEEWEIEEGAMPHLRSLSLAGLSKLRMFPEGLRYLTSLQELKLERMKRSLVERIEVIDGREGEDFSKVSHIPSIQY